MESLKKVLTEPWASITPKQLRAIIKDVPGRTLAVIECRGAHFSN